MLKFLNLQPEVFGVDVNDLALRIVKLRQKRGGFQVASCGEAHLDPGIVKEGFIQNQDALAKALQLACTQVQGEKLGSKHVAVALPEEKSFSHVMPLPGMSQEELQSAVQFEAENYIPLAIDKVYLDFQVIDGGQKDAARTNVMVSVMPKPIVDSYVASFKKAGLIPCVMEVESQAIARSLIKKDEAIKPFMIVDFGMTKTSFVIIAEGSVRFTWSLPISSQQLTQSIADALGLSTEKAEKLKIKYGLSQDGGKKYGLKHVATPVLFALVDHIKKYINFYQSHGAHEYLTSSPKIERIVLCGSGANLYGLPDVINKELNMPVALGNPLEKIDRYEQLPASFAIRQKPLSFTTAIGLAMRGMENP